MRFTKGVRVGGIRPELALAMVTAHAALQDVRGEFFIVDRIDDDSFTLRRTLPTEKIHDSFGVTLAKRLTDEFVVETRPRELVVRFVPRSRA